MAMRIFRPRVSTYDPHHPAAQLSHDLAGDTAQNEFLQGALSLPSHHDGIISALSLVNDIAGNAFFPLSNLDLDGIPAESHFPEELAGALHEVIDLVFLLFFPPTDRQDLLTPHRIVLHVPECIGDLADHMEESDLALGRRKHCAGIVDSFVCLVGSVDHEQHSHPLGIHKGAFHASCVSCTQLSDKGKRKRRLSWPPWFPWQHPAHGTSFRKIM